MNERQKELLRIMLTKHNDSFLVKDLSKDLNCSEKTVRNDFNQIDDFLKSYSSAALLRKPGVGVHLEINSEERIELFQVLHSNRPKSDEERTIEVAYQLLISKKSISLQQFAEKYFVQNATIKKDLANISKWLNRFELKIVSKQRIGNRINGTELNKRNALAHLSQLIPTLAGETNYVLDLFLPYEISMVRKVLHDLHQNYSIAFSDGAMESLLVHALIMVKRTQQHSTVSIADYEKKDLHYTNEYHYATDILEKLEAVFRISFPQEELIYFTLHLISCKKTRFELDHVRNDDLMAIVTKITSKLNQLTLFNFEEDEVLMDGLTIHMYTVLNRLTYGFPITNPLLSDIKKMYPYMFSMIVLALEDLSESLNLHVPEDEVAYLVLHFQASLERLQKKRNTKKNVLIVCHMGIGMSRLLQAKLEQNYKEIFILDCIGKEEVTGFFEDNNVDIIISTVPIEQKLVPHIVISPLLEAEDKDKLNQFFHQLENKPKEFQDTHSLSKLIDQELVYLHVNEQHRFKVVEMLATELYNKEIVDKKFIHSTLSREKNSATSIGGAIAIPHGSPSLVYRSAVAVAVLEKPLEWGDEMVSIVFMLAISNDKENPIKALIQQIASISEQPFLVKSLELANDATDFITHLTN